MNVVRRSGRSLLVLAGAVAVLCILMAPAERVRAQALTPSGLASVAVIESLVSTPQYGLVDVALGSDGSPVVVHTKVDFDTRERSLHLDRCMTPDCVGDVVSGNLLFDEVVNPTSPQIVIGADDLAVIAFHDFADDTMKLVRCRDTTCQSPLGPELLRELPSPDFANHLSLDLTPDGHPVVGWSQEGTGNEFRDPTAYFTLICLDADCIGSRMSRERPEPSTRVFAADLAVDRTGDTVVTAVVRPGEIEITSWSRPAGLWSSRSGVIPSVFNVFDLSIGFGADGAPILAYSTSRGSLGMVLEVLDCADPVCANFAVARPLPVALDFISSTELEITDAGDAIVSFWGQDPVAAMQVVACSGGCGDGQASWHRVLPGDPFGIAMTLSPSGHPVVVGPADSLLLVGVCDSPGCGVVESCLGFGVTVDLARGESPTAGDDVVIGTDEDDEIAAGDGDDVVCGGGGDDRIWGQSGADILDGAAGDDVIRGGSGDDFVYGRDGADDLNGGRDNDWVFGGEGADIAVRGGTGDDGVDGGPGDDLLINGNGGRDFVRGGPGNDQLVAGGPRPDRIFGDDGNDVLRGNGGADQIEGGSGDDDIRGGPQADLLRGDSGTDVCNGGTTGSGALEFDRAENCEVLVAVP